MDQAVLDRPAAPTGNGQLGNADEHLALPFPLSLDGQRLKRSMMRQLIAVTAQPDVISFAGGLPAPELLPVVEWAECTARTLAEDGPPALQYGPQYPPLLEHIAALMARRGADVPPERIFITNGCQQGLQIAARLLMDPDSSAVVDRYVFPGVRQAFGGMQRELREVETDAVTGLDVATVAGAVISQPTPRALVVVPDFHNPLGTSLSEEARDALVALARAHRVAIVEDDPYSMLAFDGHLSTPLLARAPERTIYLGSFSKLIAPALRMGWLVAPDGLADKLRVIKESMDLESSALTQRVVARFLAGGYLDAHLQAVRATYAERCRVMTAAIAEHFPAGTRCSAPAGGMFIWAQLPMLLDTLEILGEAIQSHVAYIPGVAFTSEGRRSAAMRLNFSNASPERIRQGVAILGAVLRRYPDGSL